MKATKKQINDFLGTKKIAIAGVSRDETKFGTVVFNELKEKGYDVYPVNPNTDTINGVSCYRSVSDLPAGIDSLLLVTPKARTLDPLKEAVNRGIRNIWIQQMSETPEIVEYVKAGNIRLIMKQCILMHTEPVKGLHKFHRTVYSFFGVLPK